MGKMSAKTRQRLPTGSLGKIVQRTHNGMLKDHTVTNAPLLPHCITGNTIVLPTKGVGFFLLNKHRDPPLLAQTTLLGPGITGIATTTIGTKGTTGIHVGREQHTSEALSDLQFFTQEPYPLHVAIHCVEFHTPHKEMCVHHEGLETSPDHMEC